MMLSRPLQLVFVPNRKARRYILRLHPEGYARVTIPRGGSVAEGERFAQRHADWLEKQLQRRLTAPPVSREWHPGDQILFRGERVRLEVQPVEGRPDRVGFAGQTLKVRDLAADLRAEIERYLWRLAKRELPARTLALAAIHHFPVERVSVRNQRSRWGSCSRRGTVSLNWRLVQTPLLVRDYIICHELAHLKEMNHSRRFWAEVRRLCPDYLLAERWLKEHRDLLR